MANRKAMIIVLSLLIFSFFLYLAIKRAVSTVCDMYQSSVLLVSSVENNSFMLTTCNLSLFGKIHHSVSFFIHVENRACAGMIWA